MKSLDRVWTIFLRQFFLLKRSPYRIFALFYWPVMELFLWGILTSYISKIGGERLSFTLVLIGAIIFFNFFLRIQHGITISFLEDAWVRNFINLFASPLTLAEYILGLLLTSVFQLVFSIGLMTLLAWLFFAYNIFQFGFLLIPFVLVLFLFGLALGILVTAIILRLGPTSEILTWALPAVVSPLSGVFYPVDILPGIIRVFARALPSTYVFDGMRTAALNGIFNVQGFLLAFVISVIWLAASYWFLLRVYRVVLHKGLFTRFLTD